MDRHESARQTKALQRAAKSVAAAESRALIELEKTKKAEEPSHFESNNNEEDLLISDEDLDYDAVLSQNLIMNANRIVSNCQM